MPLGLKSRLQSFLLVLSGMSSRSESELKKMKVNSFIRCSRHFLFIICSRLRFFLALTVINRLLLYIFIINIYSAHFQSSWLI